MNFFERISMKFFALAMGLFLVAPLFAQEATPSPVLEATQAQPVTLEEIVVQGNPVGLAVKELSGDDIQTIRDTGNLGMALDEQSGVETQGEGMGKAWNTL